MFYRTKSATVQIQKMSQSFCKISSLYFRCHHLQRKEDFSPDQNNRANLYTNYKLCLHHQLLCSWKKSKWTYNQRAVYNPHDSWQCIAEKIKTFWTLDLTINKPNTLISGRNDQFFSPSILYKDTMGYALKSNVFLIGHYMKTSVELSS